MNKIMTIINGRKIRDGILEKAREEVKKLSFTPVFCDIMVGADPVSKQYVDMKAKTAESVGIKFHNADFPSSITTEELVAEIEKLNKEPFMCGIIVQLPLPATLNKRAVLDAISPGLDVDFLGTEAGKEFYEGRTERGFPTALACLSALDSLGLDLKDKKIAVLGQGELVGKPVAALIRRRGLEPEVVNSKTENKEAIIKEADVIISGIGKGKYIKGDMIKPGAVIIDAGTSEDNNSIVGDVDLESVSSAAGAVSPVPGGVGPITVAMLLENVLHVAKSKQ